MSRSLLIHRTGVGPAQLHETIGVADRDQERGRERVGRIAKLCAHRIP